VLKRSRVARSLDVGRLSKALERPGIDPRTWVSLAVVDEIVIDPAEGVFVDVTLLPSRVSGTARLGAAYAGAGFGLYAPLHLDDEVLVEAPSGDPDEGLIVTLRLHSPSDPPPSEITANPQDVLLLVEAGRTVRIATQGSGNVVVEARGTGQVRLGAEAATRGVARVGDATAISGADLVALQANLDLRYTLLAAPAPLTSVSGTVATGSSKVRSA